MSIIAFPRREATKLPSRPGVTRRPTSTPRPIEVPGAAHRVPRRSIRRRIGAVSLPMRVATVATLALFVILIGNTYSAQRQVELHTLQNDLLQAQSQYAQQVANLTNVADPAHVASRAGSLHLVVPSSVTQIAPVPLNVPLPAPHLAGDDIVSSRTYR